jgi:hypothetical protein
MRKLLSDSSLVSIIIGTIVLSVTANAYELLCTAGFPMVFTRVLTLHNLTPTQYYSYLVLYNIIYIIPLAIIVIGLSFTIGTMKLTEWRGRVLKLISGVMMFSLGLVLLINPEMLNNLVYTVVLLLSVLFLSYMLILRTINKDKNEKSKQENQ